MKFLNIYPNKGINMSIYKKALLLRYSKCTEMSVKIVALLIC